MAYPSFNSGDVLNASDMNAVGLWKIASGTLSLTTTPSNVTGVFTSDYKNYRLLLNITTRSTTNRVDIRYIIGTTSTIVNYYQNGIGSDYASDTTLYMQRSNNDNRFYGLASSNEGAIVMDIFNPNRIAATYHTGHVYDRGTGVGYSIGGIQTSGVNQYTGFQLFTSTGTATVEYQVFGYRD